ncbi:MAG: hypothetical protein IJ610_08565 [Bacteroidaceae bacterium]|nr:hypothetical protein [Bacteroidaceae bacterium]
MKQFLSTIAFIAGIVPTIKGQTDVTEQYIKNPDFEINYLTYWHVSGIQMQNNASFAKHGGVYVEKWTNKGNGVGSASITQELKNLPQGQYTLKVLAQNIQQDSPTAAQSGAVVFAGDNTTAITTPGEYSVDFTHLHGNITIGFRLTNATGNYCCCDNFRLYRNGNASESAALEDARLYEEERAALAELYANASGATPSVKGNDYIAIGGVFALGRFTVTTNGATIKERGYCFSKSNPEPTVMDSVSTYAYSHEGSIYVIEPLTPETFYWIRPYVITKDNVVAYGESKYIATLPKASCTWTYGYEGDDAQNARIVQAINNGIVNYNECTAIKKFNLSGHYVWGAGAGSGTAECKYGGEMNISQAEAYQRTGTVQHEFAHGVGVGTRKIAWGFDAIGSWDNTDVHDWVWKGRRANDFVQFMENSKEVQVVGDGTHGWAQNTNGRTNKLIDYGINGANEDNNTQLLYRANAMFVEAMHEDGLNATWNNKTGTPCYSYIYHPLKKYYLMNKDSEGGLGEGLLYQRASTDIAWRPLLTGEVISNSAAWYMEYDPQNSLYSFKNASTGKYLTHPTTGNLCVRVVTTNPSSTEKFQLMPDRTDVTIEIDGKKNKTHGYWFTWESSGSQSMSAASFSKRRGYGSISQEPFNYSDDATTQQWIILSEDELAAYQQKAIETGISTITVNDNAFDGEGTIAGIYTTEGISLDTLQKGINIVKYSNGQVKKIIFK